MQSLSSWVMRTQASDRVSLKICKGRRPLHPLETLWGKSKPNVQPLTTFLAEEGGVELLRVPGPETHLSEKEI